MARYYESRWITGQDTQLPNYEQIRLVNYADYCINRPVVPWLWNQYLAAGTIAILDGDPGVGKSLLAIDLMARLAADKPMPDGSAIEADRDKHVFLVNNEDPHNTVLIPRFLAAGCPSSRLIFFGGLTDEPKPKHCEPYRPTLFPRDWPHFQKAVNGFKPSLVVIDPISAAFSADIATSNDQLFREALTPFAELALKTGTCFLFVRHLTKKGATRSLYRGAGTIGIAGAARTVLLAAPHPENPDERILAVVKNNFATVPPSQRYRIVKRQMYAEHPHGPPTPLPPMAQVEWLGPSPITAQELAECSLGTDSAGQRAQAFLKRELATGPKPQTEIADNAMREGISYRTLKNAKKLLGIQSRRVVEGEVAWWEWERG